MTLVEYVEKLGLKPNSAQIQLFNLIEERKDESLIITFPRLSGRRLIYNLVERKKGYDEGYKQGREDAIEEYNLKVRNELLMIECMEEAVEVVDRVANEMKGGAE